MIKRNSFNESDELQELEAEFLGAAYAYGKALSKDFLSNWMKGVIEAEKQGRAASFPSPHRERAIPKQNGQHKRCNRQAKLTIRKKGGRYE